MYNSIIKTLKIRFFYNTCCYWKPSTRVHQNIRRLLSQRCYFTSYNYQILKTYLSNESLPIEHFILSLFQFINKYFIIQNFDQIFVIWRQNKIKFIRLYQVILRHLICCIMTLYVDPLIKKISVKRQVLLIKKDQFQDLSNSES